MIERNVLEGMLERNLEAQLSQGIQAMGYPHDSVCKLFRFASIVFRKIPPEFITWKFNIVLPIGNWNYEDKQIISIGDFCERFVSECTVIAVSESQFIIEPLDTVYTDDHVLYSYFGPYNEKIRIGEAQYILNEYVDSTACSIFAPPTYKELDEALDFYNNRYAKDSCCLILQNVWSDTSKQEFVAKPERFMRDSLWQCLQNTLRNHTVKREQNVDATHPVDIKVTWPINRNVALVEVKWLGDSGSIKYRDARANEGAKQLIDYIASSAQEEPEKYFMGYLTVFDGRRGSSKNQYETREINYNTDYLDLPYMKYKRLYMAEN